MTRVVVLRLWGARAVPKVKIRIVIFSASNCEISQTFCIFLSKFTIFRLESIGLALLAFTAGADGGPFSRRARVVLLEPLLEPLEGSEQCQWFWRNSMETRLNSPYSLTLSSSARRPLGALHGSTGHCPHRYWSLPTPKRCSRALKPRIPENTENWILR